jgi:hypothetical protein
LISEVLWIFPHTLLWESFFFDASSHIHDHHMDVKLQEHDLSCMAHLEFARYFFFLHSVDVLKVHMRAPPSHSYSSRHTCHLIFFIFFFFATLKPTYGSSIAYGKIPQV